MSLPCNSNGDDASSHAISRVGGDGTFHCASDHRKNRATSHTSQNCRKRQLNDDEESSNNNELHRADKSSTNIQRAVSSTASSPAAPPKKAKNNNDSNEDQNNNQHQQHHQQPSPPTNENSGSSGAAENNKHIPKRVDSVDDAVDQMKSLLKVDELISGTDDPVEKKYYQKIEVILEKHLREEFDKGTYHINNLGKLTEACGKGIYALWISSSIPLKVGMSAVNKKMRAKQQIYKEAFDIASEEQVKKMCPNNSTVVNAIKNEMPPSLNFYYEKEDARTLLIQLQIVELMIASCHETSTGTAGERFMWWPSKEIQQFTTLLSADDFSAEDIAFFNGVDKNDVDNIFRFLFTWSTYKSNIFSRRKGGDKSLLRLLPDAPDDEFVQKHTTKRAFGLSRVPEHTDAVDESVRSVQMKGIIKELEVLLKRAKNEVEASGSMTEKTSQAIRAILDRINNESDDYKHYKEPEKRIIAKAAVIQLRSFIDTNIGEIIMWERHMYDAMKQYEEDAFNELIPPKSKFVEVVKGTTKLLRITTTLPSGKVVKHLIIRSFFRIFAEETSLAVIKSEIAAYLATISYLCVSGIVTREYAEREARVMRTFLMEYEGYKGNIMDGKADGSFRAARLHAVGRGLCIGGSLENVRSVATGVLHIGYLEALDLYSNLGDELFGLLLGAFGIRNGINNPMSETFVCPGAEDGRPCPYEGNDEERPPVYVAGIKTKDFSLPKRFACHYCAKATSSLAHTHSTKYAQKLAKSRHVTELTRRAKNGETLSTDEQTLVDTRTLAHTRSTKCAKELSMEQYQLHQEHLRREHLRRVQWQQMQQYQIMQQKQQKSFVQQWDDLNTYKEKHGHVNVKASEDKSLFDFCSRMRYARNNQDSAALTNMQIASLDILGFVWS